MTLEDKFTELQTQLGNQHIELMNKLTAQQSSLDTMAINSGLQVAALGFVKADTGTIAALLPDLALDTTAIAASLASLRGVDVPAIIAAIEAVTNAVELGLPDDSTYQAAVLASLSTIEGRALQIQVNTAETVARITTTNTTLVFSQSNQFTQLTQLTPMLNQLVALKNILLGEISGSLLDDLVNFISGQQYTALSNIATSGNANNSVLVALNANASIANTHLQAIEDCSCDNTPPPEPSVGACGATYTVPRLVGTVGANTPTKSFGTVNEPDTYVYKTVVNAVDGLTLSGNFTQGSNIFQVSEQCVINTGTTPICIENTGTQLCYILVPSGSNWAELVLAAGEFVSYASNTKLALASDYTNDVFPLPFRVEIHSVA